MENGTYKKMPSLRLKKQRGDFFGEMTINYRQKAKNCYNDNIKEYMKQIFTCKGQYCITKIVLQSFTLVVINTFVLLLRLFLQF